MNERILLVDDNKTLVKLIQLKIIKELGLEVDVAYSKSEAELFCRKHQYFLAVLDLNLPDAPNGEIVDSILRKHIPSIVLTGNIDKDFRNQMFQKEIIDYVQKGGVEDIDYVIDVIRRLLKNRQHKIMVVDDSVVFRNQMKKMLENLFFHVYAVAHGEEALGILREYPDIRIIVTDYNMPVMDGLELTKAVRKEYDKNQLSIFVLSSSDNPDVSAMFLKRGANDFINKPFSKEEFSCRIHNAIEALENIDTITHFASRDFLTGLYNRRHFFTVAEPYFAQANEQDEEFAVAMLDIDHFKRINDMYGHDVGDKVIVHLSEILRSNIGAQDIAARFGGEEFCIVLKRISRDKAVDVFERIRNAVSKTPLILKDGTEIIFSISIGMVSDLSDTLNDMVNDADIKLYHAKNNGRNQIVI